MCSRRRRNRSYFLGMLLLLCLSVLTGCAMPQPREEQTITGFAFNTVYTLTLYEGGSQKLLDSCVAQCTTYEEIFSTTKKNSELYAVNALERTYEELRKKRKGKFTSRDISWYQEQLGKRQEAGTKNLSYTVQKDGSLSVTLSKNLSKLLQKGLDYGKLSGGRFDISIEPISRLWDFTADQPKVPDDDAIQKALPKVNVQNLTLQGQVATFAVPGMGIDLGGIAKGYIADQLKRYLQEQGVTSGMIDLGGNILCIGRKRDGGNFQIGIQQPFADRNETIAAVSVKDCSIVSSGIYERFFKTSDGTLYHHILNPKTGYSYENDLLGVTILSNQSVDGDGFSTTCFALGLEQGMKLVNDSDNVEAVFITSDEQMHYSDGFEQYIVK